MPADRQPSRSLPTVFDLIARVAAERCIDFEPMPASLVESLPALVGLVDDLAERLDEPQERRWLGAALAALSHHALASNVAEHSAEGSFGRGDGDPDGVIAGTRMATGEPAGIDPCRP